MENMSIYENIGRRTGGDIYMGVVGPVRAGKSTFIKRFMDLMVLPNVSDTYEKQRILDEMPQSGSGRTITTTEPKFIPAEAVELHAGGMNLKVRLVDCVGYMVPGALGDTEEGEPRMVATPWNDEKLPFVKAAEIGTEKVIKDHSTVGIVITTDGTIDTLERDSYRDAEEKVIRQLFDLRKPFVIIMNTTEPDGMLARREAGDLSDKFGVPVIRMDCARASEEDVKTAMTELLGRFPVREVAFHVPGYVEGLDSDHWLKSQLIENIKYWAHDFETIEELRDAAALLADGQIVKS
ncbi:MAG: stage IV sporulation protein A, partial [Firmicutes bacterium]|nr:stage IV sporulation protein A [Bacillota bacterium]